MNVGRPVSAILYGMSRGAIMLYNGQEVGERAPARKVSAATMRAPASSITGRCGVREVGERAQLRWRSTFARAESAEELLQPPHQSRRRTAFRDGKFFPLNPANRENERFGRLPGEQASGHWLYAFLRYDPLTGQRFLVVANLHPETALRDVRIVIPESALQPLDLNTESSHPKLKLIEWLTETPLEIRLTLAEAVSLGILLPRFPRSPPSTSTWIAAPKTRRL